MRRRLFAPVVVFALSLAACGPEADPVRCIRGELDCLLTVRDDGSCTVACGEHNPGDPSIGVTCEEMSAQLCG